MTGMNPNEESAGKFAGARIELTGLGRVELTRRFKGNGDTSIYFADRAGMAVKLFDLDCGKEDEVAYGPYIGFKVEVENFEDITRIEELRTWVPAYYGSGIRYEGKYAYIAMELIEGLDLQSWCDEAAQRPNGQDWVEEFRETVYETLSILRRFHKHRIVLIDFKADNVIRLYDRKVRFVDLGAFFTPRHSNATENYVYSATPDYAELVIDTSNVQTEIPLTEASDIFASGVALFEMATGRSRLLIADETARDVLGKPEIYRFRDTQIRDVWRAYPHLQSLLPLLETQLSERQVLFSEVWFLIKGLLTHELSDWEELTPDKRRDLILDAGVNFITEQLPGHLRWLGEPIARATALRSMRLNSVGELMALIANPVEEAVREDLRDHNGFVQYLRDLERPLDCLDVLNTWDARQDRTSSRWALSTRVAYEPLKDGSQFTFLKQIWIDDEQHRFYQIVDDVEADNFNESKLCLADLKEDHFAWLE